MINIALAFILLLLVYIAIKIEKTAAVDNSFLEDIYDNKEARKEDNKTLKQLYKSQKEKDLLDRDLRKQLLKNGLL